MANKNKQLVVAEEVVDAEIVPTEDEIRTQWKSKLAGQGFSPSGSFTRRQVFEDIVPEENASPTGYRTTMAEICDKQFGRDNWGLVPTGRIIDHPDPWQDETTEITEWQNREYDLFVRDPKLAAELPNPQTFHDIEAGAEQAVLSTGEQPV